MSAPELKPCPFCGEANQETLMVLHLEGTIRHPAYCVKCDNCGASTGYSDRGDHITEWNTRADPAPALAVPEVAKLVEAAKSGLRFIENTEGELGIVIGCGDALRAALAALRGEVSHG